MIICPLWTLLRRAGHPDPPGRRTLSVLPADGQPLADYIAERYELHASLVEAVAGRDKDKALHLIAEHNTTDRLRPPPPVLSAGLSGLA